MLHIVLGVAGSGKTYWVRNRIAEMVRSGESNIALLVPEQNNYESERAMLKLLSSAPTDIVEVISFTRLAESVCTLSGNRQADAADDAVKMLVMGRAVKSVKSELRVYGKACETEEFCKSVLELVSEFKRSDIKATELVDAAAGTTGALSAKAADLSLIISAYEAMLLSRFSDPLDDLTKLSECLNSVGYFNGRTVFIDAFKGFTAQQYAVLGQIFSQAKDVYITFCCDSLQDNAYGVGLFSNIKKTANRIIALARERDLKIAPIITVNNDYRFNGSVISNVEQLFRGAQLDDECAGGEITVCSCGTVYDEADYIVRTIRKLVRTQGYLYRDFAVVARDMANCRGALINAFERYNVPCFSDSRVDADTLALMRFVSNAIACAANGYAAEHIMPFIKSVLSPLSIEEACELENYALIWNKHGRQWTEVWTQNPNGLEERFDEEGLERINRLRLTVIAPLVELEHRLKDGKVEHVCRAIWDMLMKLKVDKKLSEYAQSLSESGDQYFAQLHLRSWDTLVACLDSMVRAFGGEGCSKSEFVSLFEMLISNSDIGSIPDRIDEVIIGSADKIRVGNPKVVMLLGANYTVFPKTSVNSGLLSNSDRRKLINGGLNMPDYSAEHSSDEQFLVYNAACSASERLYITYHTVSLSGDNCTPSEFVKQIVEQIPQTKTTRAADTDEDKFEGVLPSIELVSAQHWKKYARSLSDSFSERGIQSATLVDSILSGRGEMRLTPNTAVSLFGKDIKISATKVENYSKCPFSYFCEFGMKAKPIKRAELDAMQRGTLVHYVLERIVSTHGKGISALTDEERMDEIAELIREYSDRAFGGYSKLDRDFLFLIQRVAVVLESIVRRIGEDFSQSEFTPDRCELRIGTDELDAVRIALSNGSLVLRGSVDRVDVYKADGRTYVRVVDYKTGSKQFDMSDLFYGINMQMLLYLFAITNSKLYENAECAGILYMPSKRAVVNCDRRTDSDKISAMKDDELRMNGLLIDDAVVLDAMESGGRGKYIPFYNYAGARKQSWTASKEDFERIESKVYSVLHAMGESIHKGLISIDPVDTANGSACKYCDYRQVCLNNGESNRRAEKYTLKQALEKLAEEGSYGV